MRTLIQRTSFRSSGRFAGTGTSYDDYGDESYGGYHDQKCYDIRFPHDGKEKEMNGPVIIIRKGKKK